MIKGLQIKPHEVEGNVRLQLVEKVLRRRHDITLQILKGCHKEGKSLLSLAARHGPMACSKIGLDQKSRNLHC